MLNCLNVVVQFLDVINYRGQIFMYKLSGCNGESLLESPDVMTTATTNINEQHTISRPSINDLLLGRKPVSPVRCVISTALHEGVKTAQCIWVFG